MKNKLIIASLLLVAAACNNGNKPADSVDSARAVNEQKDTSSMRMDTTKVDKAVSDFVTNAASGGMMEVELGKLAATNASSDRVKAFGNMMVEDHTRANNELKDLASRKGIAIPSMPGDQHQKHINELSKEKGANFDKKYMSMMLDDHKEDVKMFEKAAADLTDAQIKGFASSTLPTLLKHLDSAKAITGKK